MHGDSKQQWNDVIKTLHTRTHNAHMVDDIKLRYESSFFFYKTCPEGEYSIPRFC